LPHDPRGRSSGALREWHWHALAKAYAADDEGLGGEDGDYARIGWNTWLRLRDYKRGALVEEVPGISWCNPPDGPSGTVYRLRGMPGPQAAAGYGPTRGTKPRGDCHAAREQPSDLHGLSQLAKRQPAGAIASLGVPRAERLQADRR